MSSEYYVSMEGDRLAPIPDVDGTAFFKTYGKAREFLNRLRGSPQWDFTVEIQEVRHDPDKAAMQKAEVGEHIWISKFGSDRLRKARDLGHPCDECYLTERARYEGLSGYTIDFEKSMKTEPIMCPSVAAIAEIERLAYRYKPRVVKLIYVRRSGDKLFTHPHREACVVSFMGYKFFKCIKEV